MAVFEADLGGVGAQLPAGSEWVREDSALWQLGGSQGLSVRTAPGSIWGDFGKEVPARNTLLLPCTVDPYAGLAVEATVSCSCRSRGEQGGLLLYTDDDHWIKLVLEGMRDGSCALVFARSVGGSPQVVYKKRLAAQAGEVAATCLRLTVHASGVVTAGAGLDAGEVLASCPTLLGPSRVAFMAHGGADDDGAAVLRSVAVRREAAALDPAPRLWYFAGRGLGEPIRFVLGAAGVEYDESYLRTRQPFVDLVASGKLMFAQVPLLEMDGLCLVQSASIARYVADKFQLAGTTAPAHRAQVDALFEGAHGFYRSMTSLPFVDDAADRAAALKNLVVTAIPKQLATFERLYQAEGRPAATGEHAQGPRSGPYLTGPCLTYADAVLLLAVLSARELSAACLEGCPGLAAWLAAMQAHPHVAAFLASAHHHPRPDASYVREVRIALGRIEAD